MWIWQREVVRRDQLAYCKMTLRVEKRLQLELFEVQRSRLITQLLLLAIMLNVLVQVRRNLFLVLV